MYITAILGFIILAAVVATFVVVLLAFLLMRRARRGVPGAQSFGWALLFLTSGRMPSLQPASQIEAELNTEKDRLVGRGKDQAAAGR